MERLTQILKFNHIMQSLQYLKEIRNQAKKVSRALVKEKKVPKTKVYDGQEILRSKSREGPIS